MFLCYIDESGTPETPGTSSHFVLCGLAISDDKWKSHHRQIEAIKLKHDLSGSEIHTAWMLRKYLEQDRIEKFESLDKAERIASVRHARSVELERLKKIDKSRFSQTKKNYVKTDAYIHLTYNQRMAFLLEIAECVSKWIDARIFAECIDKNYHDPSKARKAIIDQAFEQVVTRFEHFLSNVNSNLAGLTTQSKHYGILIHDNNDTVSSHHTQVMKRFLDEGTTWRSLKHLIETPMFVNSELTGMVQISDLCSYALRRYLENSESEFFDLIFKRADRIRSNTVGIRHFTDSTCLCKICTSHKIN